MRFLNRFLVIGKWVAGVFLLLLFVLGLVSVLPIRPPAQDNIDLGFTFSVHAAEALGLDWRDAYAAALSELNPAIIRLPVYWDRLEPQPGNYEWQEIDDMLDQAEAGNVDVILAIGHKLPRWPECHIPEWMQEIDEDAAEPALMRMLEDVVNRYKTHPAVAAWQVENEALFYFGECPQWSRNRDRLSREIELVRSLDDRPVMTSDSGELSLWLRTSTLPVDALAISVYRKFYEANGYWDWPVNPFFYQWRRWLIKPFTDRVIVSELQMEPWGPRPINELSEDDVAKSFPVSEFADRLDFAARLGADTVIAWGVEWWYYRQQHGDSSYWNAAKDNFATP